MFDECFPAVLPDEASCVDPDPDTPVDPSVWSSPAESDAGWAALVRGWEQQARAPRTAGLDLAVWWTDSADYASFPPASADVEDPSVVAAEYGSCERVFAGRRMVGWAQAGEMVEVSAMVARAVARALAEQDARVAAGCPGSDESSVTESAVGSVVAELALGWRVSPRTAASRVDEAVSLVAAVPRSVGLLGQGRVELAHVRAVAEVACPLGSEGARRVEDAVLPEMAGATPAQVRAAARRAAVGVDPEAAEKRRLVKRRARSVRCDPAEDGMAVVTAYLPAEQALVLFGTVDAHARRTDPVDPGGGRRSMDARRADTLVDLVAGGALLAAGATSAVGPATESATGPAADAGDDDGPCGCGDRAAASGGLDFPVDDERFPTDGTETEETEETEETDGVDGTDGHNGDGHDGDGGGSGSGSGSGWGSGSGSDRARRRRRDRERGRVERGRAERRGSPGRHAGCRRCTEGATRWPRPPRTEVRVVVSADTLLGLDQRPGDLIGYGPVTAAHARELAADRDASWRRVLTDPESGTVLDVGTTRYRPPAAMAEHVMTRDRWCGFPGCRMPAWRCDLDHVVAFDPATGTGPTSAVNLDPKCRRHHLLKHQRGWKVRRLDDGGQEWITPSGHRYVCPRPALIPGTPTTTTATTPNSATTATTTAAAATVAAGDGPPPF